MDVKTLREIYRKERMSPYLQDVGKDFYKQIESYIKEIYSKYEEHSKKEEISKLAVLLGEFENIKATINDVYEIRERKIVSNALYYVKSGEEVGVENLTSEEEAMLKKIAGILREQRSSVLDNIISEKAAAEMRMPETKEKQLTLKEKMITIRILKDLPQIVGVDGKVYGAFKEEDVVTLPEPNGLVFINQGVAEQVNIA
ncbi:MAG: hypothetical protein ABH874_04870 [Methanobacteriota archaeon]